MTASHPHDHEQVIMGIAEQLAPVFDASPQGIYVYLDDTHKVCNERFATMLGFASAADWSTGTAPFTEANVAEESWERLVMTYRHAVEHFAADTIDVTWKRRDGGLVPSSVILVPISYGDEVLALHFVTPA